MVNVQIGKHSRAIAGAIAAAFLAAGCSSTSTSNVPTAGAESAAKIRALAPDLASNSSVLKTLTNQVVIGSTIDPTNGAQNPYGLTVAPSTHGMFTAGDLVVCNFNGKSNQQGSGKSIVALHPTPGSTPTHVSGSQALLGCAALALAPDDTIWAAAMAANDNPILGSGGKLLDVISGKPLVQPWGQLFATPESGAPALYETNAVTGSVVRINLGSPFTFDVIARGFPRNRGVAGTILAPSGLAYDARIDTLYLADGKSNIVVALKNVSTIPDGGIVATNHGMTFSGPYASDARVIFAGAPLNGPISTALLPNGNLVVGNTLDPNGTNLIIEISTTTGKVLATRNVDPGAAGALFGMVATGTNNANTKVYFNDDNAANVQVLER